MTAPALPAGALDSAVVSYLVDCRARGHREATLDLRRNVLKRLSEHTAKPVLTLTNEDVHSFYIQFRALSQASRYSYAMCLRSFFRWALDREMITTDPTRGLPIPKSTRGKPKPMTPDQLHLGLQKAGPRMRLWIMLGASAGLRAGEIARLNREHIDTRLSPPAIDVVNGKGGADRTVTIGENLATELSAWRVRFGRMWQVSPHRVTCDVSRYFEGLGIPATCHSLRHTYASTLYVESGSDIRLVQEMLGHASLSSTQVYTQFAPRKAIQAIDVVDQLVADAAALPLEARQRVAQALLKLDEPTSGAE